MHEKEIMTGVVGKGGQQAPMSPVKADTGRFQRWKWESTPTLPCQNTCVSFLVSKTSL